MNFTDTVRYFLSLLYFLFLIPIPEQKHLRDYSPSPLELPPEIISGRATSVSSPHAEKLSKALLVLRSSSGKFYSGYPSKFLGNAQQLHITLLMSLP